MVVPAISVITPTKNRAALLQETLDSVAAQDFLDWEHIIVDDGSNDGTAEMMAQRCASDPRVRYLRREGEMSGASVCRNLGAAQSSAPLMVFLDSDDLLAAEALGRRVEWMERNPDLDFMVFTTGVFEKTPGDLNKTFDAGSGDDLLGFLLMEPPWQTSAPTWRKAAFDRIGGFEPTLPSWQDVELHIRALCSDLVYIRRPQIDHFMRWQWEDTKVSIEQRRSPRHLAAADAILRRFETLVRQGPGMNWLRQRALCSAYFFVAERWMDIGQRGEAMACWRQVRSRALGPASLFIAGALLLRLQAPSSPLRGIGARLTHKWKGWARLRLQPEMVSP